VNIFIVSQLTSKSCNQNLISHISSIQLECKKTVPIVVVEDTYNLSELPSSQRPVDHTRFVLRDFQYNVVANGVEPNKMAQVLSRVETSWVMIDFGQHDQATCVDFIQALSRYCYTNSNLRNRSLIFTVQAAFLVLFARTCNESFNNLPASGIALAQSSGTSSLFRSIRIERLLARLLLASAVRRIRQYLLQILRRFAGVVRRDFKHGESNGQR
jgi:hypothetical protein